MVELHGGCIYAKNAKTGTALHMVIEIPTQSVLPPARPNTAVMQSFNSS